MSEVTPLESRTPSGKAVHPFVWVLLTILGGFIHYGLWVFDRVFEYVWYPQVIIAHGVVNGTLLMMVASWLICLFFLWGYDNWPWQWLRDALRYESLKGFGKEVEEELLHPEPPKFLLGTKEFADRGPWILFSWLWGLIKAVLGVLLILARVLLYLFRKHILRPLWLALPWLRPTLLFLYLSLAFDPMTTAIMMRPQGKHTMGKGDWAIFYGSVFISNASWGLMIWTGVETLEALVPGIWDKLNGLF